MSFPFYHTKYWKDICLNFLGGPVVKNPANTGDTGSIPGLERSHRTLVAVGHLSPCTTTAEAPCAPTTEAPASHAEAQAPRALCAATEALLQWEVHAPQLASSPCSPQLEKTHTQQRKISAARNKNKRHALQDCQLIKLVIFTAPKTFLIETVLFWFFLYNYMVVVKSSPVWWHYIYLHSSYRNTALHHQCKCQPSKNGK